MENTKDQTIKENNKICPYCNSVEIYKYRRLAIGLIFGFFCMGGFYPFTLFYFLVPKYRCRKCKKLFGEEKLKVIDNGYENRQEAVIFFGVIVITIVLFIKFIFDRLSN